jgi:hypothetical protein
LQFAKLDLIFFVPCVQLEPCRLATIPVGAFIGAAYDAAWRFMLCSSQRVHCRVLLDELRRVDTEASNEGPAPAHRGWIATDDH